MTLKIISITETDCLRCGLNELFRWVVPWKPNFFVDLSLAIKINAYAEWHLVLSKRKSPTAANNLQPDSARRVVGKFHYFAQESPMAWSTNVCKINLLLRKSTHAAVAVDNCGSWVHIMNEINRQSMNWEAPIASSSHDFRWSNDCKQRLYVHTMTAWLQGPYLPCRPSSWWCFIQIAKHVRRRNLSTIQPPRETHPV